MRPNRAHAARLARIAREAGCGPDYRPMPTPDELRALRIAKGLTQIEVTEAIGCARASYCVERWENGRAHPQPDNHRRWAEFLTGPDPRRGVREPAAD